MLDSRAALVVAVAGQSSGQAGSPAQVHFEGAIERALALSFISKKVGILVFCSAKRPGGDWLSGSMAQEEAISMCSTWALGCALAEFHQASHADFFYGDDVLSMDGAIIASRPGSWLPDPISASFAGFAAPNMKALRESGADPETIENKKRLLDALARRCKIALQALSDSGCDSIVLGAIGCGVFEVDPLIAAQAWREALASHGAGFSRIDFALSDAPSASIAQAFGQLSNSTLRSNPPPRCA